MELALSDVGRAGSAGDHRVPVRSHL